jgi:protein SCO1/2
VFFGFTHCPEVCPTTLNDLTLAFNALGDKARDLRAVFVTVDPQRDTPEVLKDYLQSFDARILALTGSADDIAKMAKLYRVYYAKQPTSDGSYTMDHTSLVYLMNADGRFVGTLDFHEDPNVRVKKLEKLVQ